MDDELAQHERQRDGDQRGIQEAEQAPAGHKARFAQPHHAHRLLQPQLLLLYDRLGELRHRQEETHCEHQPE